MAQKRVEFIGVDSGVTSMIQKLRDSSKTLANDFIEDARKYSDSSKEQVRFIEDQIRLIEKRNSLDKESARLRAQLDFREAAQRPGATPESIDRARAGLTSQLADVDVAGQTSDLQVNLLKELIETIKVTSKQEIVDNKQTVLENIQEVNRLVASGEDVDPEEFLKTRIQESVLSPKGQQSDQQGIRGNFLSSTIGANLINDVSGGIKQLPGVNNELDLIDPIATGAGGLLGGIAGHFLKDPILGAKIGGAIGGFGGEAISRSEQERARLFGPTASLRGLAGRGVDIGGSRTDLGLDFTEQTQIIDQVVRASGKVSGSQQGAIDLATFERGLSLSQSDVLKQFELSRVTGGDTSEEILRLLVTLRQDGVISKDDRSLFGEILNNFQDITTQFSNVSERVDPNRAGDVIRQFDRVGGVFGAKDPRSGRIIQGVNQAISNPQNEFAQAANFAALRSLPGFENAELIDLKIAQEKGLQTPGFLEAILKQSGSLGRSQGASDIQGRTGLSAEASLRLYENRDKLAGLGGEEREIAIKDLIGDERQNIDRQAQENVSRLSKQSAEIANSFVTDVGTGLQEAAGLFEKTMKTAVDNIFGKNFTFGNKKLPTEGVKTPNIPKAFTPSL